MTPTETREALKQIVSITQILDLRASGDADLVPEAFAKYTDAQLCAAVLSKAVELMANYRDAEVA